MIERLASQVAAQDARIAAQEARIKELEAARGGSPPLPQPHKQCSRRRIPAAARPARRCGPQAPRPRRHAAPHPPQTASASAQMPDMGHDMALPFGPVLNLRGFFDFNFGVGSIANPLVYPIIDNGCGTCGNPATPPHTAFQAGEFDLFITLQAFRPTELPGGDGTWSGHDQ